MYQLGLNWVNFRQISSADYLHCSKKICNFGIIWYSRCVYGFRVAGKCKSLVFSLRNFYLADEMYQCK